MSAEPAEGQAGGAGGRSNYRRIGHKGADAIATGNTAETSKPQSVTAST